MIECIYSLLILLNNKLTGFQYILFYFTLLQICFVDRAYLIYMDDNIMMMYNDIGDSGPFYVDIAS